MKKMASLAAGVLIALMTISNSSAEMVNIGMGQMESSEFAALKAKVAGHAQVNTPRMSTPLVRPERYGMVAMAPEEYDTLRRVIAQRPYHAAQPSRAPKPVHMVDIGTGHMPQDEFMALKNMIRGKGAVGVGHLAAMLP